MTHSSDKRMSDGIRRPARAKLEQEEIRRASRRREHVDRIESPPQKEPEEAHRELAPALPILPEIYEEPRSPAIVRAEVSPEKNQESNNYADAEPISLYSPDAGAHADEFSRPYSEETFLDKFAKQREPKFDVAVVRPRFNVRMNWKIFEFGQGRRPLLYGTIAGAGAVCVLFIVISTVFSRVTVTVKPRVENIALDGVLAAFDTTVSQTLVSQKVIPAERLELTKIVTQEFSATDRRAVSEKARGRVKIYNAFSSVPQSLVANTRFATESGAVYRISRSITIPGAKIVEGKVVPQFIEVDILADEPGVAANSNGSLTLRIPGFSGSAKYDGFYAIAETGFSGGFVGEALVVSRDDIVKAEEAVTKIAYDALDAEASRKAPPDFTVVSALREIQIKKVVSPDVGERRDLFSVEVEAIARVFVFRESDVLDLLSGFVLGEGSKSFIDGSAELQYRVRSVDFEKGRAEVSLHGSVKTREKIDDGALRGMVQGQKEGSILELLKGRNEIATFSVAFFPPWRYSAPSNPDRVRVVVDDGL